MVTGDHKAVLIFDAGSFKDSITLNRKIRFLDHAPLPVIIVSEASRCDVWITSSARQQR